MALHLPHKRLSAIYNIVLNVVIVNDIKDELKLQKIQVFLGT